MPIVTTETTTASGHKVLRAVFSGTITVKEAEAYHRSLLPGATWEHHGHLVLGNVTDISSDVKKVLSSAKADPVNPIPVALVIPSAMMRMLASLVTRVGTNDNSEFFRDEAAGLAWLDGALTRYHQRRGAK